MTTRPGYGETLDNRTTGEPHLETPGLERIPSSVYTEEPAEEYEDEEVEETERVPSDRYLKMVQRFRRADAEFQGYRKIVDDRYFPKNYGRGDDDGKNVQGMLDPPLIYQAMHAGESRILGAHPQFYLRGGNVALDKKLVPPLEAALNAEWAADRSTFTQIAKAYRRAFRHGYALLITTYDAEFESQELARTKAKRRNRINSAQDPLMAAMLDQIETEAAAEAMALPPPEIKPTFEASDLVKSDSINTRLVEYPILDPDCADIADARFVGRTLYVYREDLEHDPRIDLDVLAMVPTKKAEDGCEDMDVVEIHELFVREWNGDELQWRRVTVAEGAPYCLESVWDPFWIGHPYSMMVWNTLDDTPFGMPQPLVFEGLYRASAGVLTKVIEGHIANRQNTTFFNESGINPEVLDALKKGSPPRYQGIQAPPGTVMANLFHTPSTPAETPEAYNTYAMMKGELDRGMGMGPNQGLSAMKSDTSAAEANFVEQASIAAMSHIERGVEAGTIDVGRKKLGYMAQFYDKARMLRLVGEEGAKVWPSEGSPFTKGDVQRGMGLTLYRGAMRPRNDASDFQNALLFMQTASANQAMTLNLNVIPLMRFMARALAGVTGESFMMMTDEQQFQEMMAKIQAAQMMGGQGVTGGNATQGSLPSGT